MTLARMRLGVVMMAYDDDNPPGEESLEWDAHYGGGGGGEGRFLAAAVGNDSGSVFGTEGLTRGGPGVDRWVDVAQLTYVCLIKTEIGLVFASGINRIDASSDFRELDVFTAMML